ncbi:MAG TPA: HAMP domain-containing protein, partial [Allocoleopsis sp.]
MQKLQEPGESLSASEPLPNLNLDKSSPGESIPNRRLGVLAAFANASFKTQQLVIGCTAALISAAVVFFVLQTSVPNVVQQGSASSSQLATLGWEAMVTGVTVGVITWMLGQGVSTRLNRDLEQFQNRFEAVLHGDWSLPMTEYSSKELGQLATTFNQMTQVLRTRFDEAQRKAEQQEKEKEHLQYKLLQVIHDLELTAEKNLLVQDTEPTDEENDEGILPPGTL